MPLAAPDTAALAADPLVGMPPGLHDLLMRLGASPTAAWREGNRAFARLDSAEGPLFARFSSASRDAAVFAHDVAIRRLLAGDPVLRSPRVLAHGRGWVLERQVAKEPLRGRDAVGLAFEAAERVATIALPESRIPPARPWVGARMLAAARSKLPVRDLLRARAVLAAAGPRRGSHGDFHPGNLLLADGELSIVDWETSGPRPWGYDLMRLHATLDREEDREDLLDRALAAAGPRRAALLRLAHALLVRTIADKLIGANSAHRDPLGAERLLALLPRFR